MHEPSSRIRSDTRMEIECLEYGALKCIFENVREARTACYFGLGQGDRFPCLTTPDDTSEEAGQPGGAFDRRT
jgi:hypothetical protein